MEHFNVLKWFTFCLRCIASGSSLQNVAVSLAIPFQLWQDDTDCNTIGRVFPLWSIWLNRYFLSPSISQESKNPSLFWKKNDLMGLKLFFCDDERREYISVTVITLCVCVCSAPVSYDTPTQPIEGNKANISSAEQQPANKSHFVWTTSLISQWCHSHTIPTCVRPHARCAVSTATSGELRPHLSLCRRWAYDWWPVGRF